MNFILTRPKMKLNSIILKVLGIMFILVTKELVIMVSLRDMCSLD